MIKQGDRSQLALAGVLCKRDSPVSGVLLLALTRVSSLWNKKGAHR